ncbi:dienelactone hydrolase family protein [Aurantiacibacter spongiae]|uniref:Dienelactone hydrolase family protein n=1 Tax=Aurantiacibacter spongiae TaxID=2488860 RepID=A0A3N5CSR7_9SPHN|nr:dienelactone hydrolase family protein [Aurantiacibacter spongiae]RPF71657.1 dienelactone hydrolase family protein [Aurantiacibacter spongiae]
MGVTKDGGFNRRQFAVIGALAGAGSTLAACAPIAGPGRGELVQQNVSFSAPGGTFDGVFIHPAEGSWPAVVLWPDIAGLRPAPIEMGRRLAQSGYAVLVGNPYYRNVAGQQFADFEEFRTENGFEKVGPWRADNSNENVMATTRALVSWLDGQAAVDANSGIGIQGYCMTGGWSIIGAAAVPGRVKAAASFHGGGLVGDAASAPVNLLDDMANGAGALIAIARNDDADNPEAKTLLRDAGEKSAASVEVEVYDGDHGWTVLDSPAYAQGEAERAWTALLRLYRDEL